MGRADEYDRLSLVDEILVNEDLVRHYDALPYIDETTALRPLPVAPCDHEVIPETFPSGR
jgi:hypothetical protein